VDAVHGGVLSGSFELFFAMSPLELAVACMYELPLTWLRSFAI
jgi:hypothetical protein